MHMSAGAYALRVCCTHAPAGSGAGAGAKGDTHASEAPLIIVVLEKSRQLCLRDAAGIHQQLRHQHRGFFTGMGLGKKKKKKVDGKVRNRRACYDINKAKRI